MRKLSSQAAANKESEAPCLYKRPNPTTGLIRPSPIKHNAIQNSRQFVQRVGQGTKDLP